MLVSMKSFDDAKRTPTSWRATCRCGRLFEHPTYARAHADLTTHIGDPVPHTPAETTVPYPCVVPVYRVLVEREGDAASPHLAELVTEVMLRTGIITRESTSVEIDRAARDVAELVTPVSAKDLADPFYRAEVYDELEGRIMGQRARRAEA